MPSATSAEAFNPRFTAADLAVHRRKAPPADVAVEQARIDRADALVLVYPVYWWSKALSPGRLPEPSNAPPRRPPSSVLRPHPSTRAGLTRTGDGPTSAFSAHRRTPVRRAPKTPRWARIRSG
ncbi:NAD(P)H-dependent oxidoreductase [Sorangium sp. So ce388]